MKKSTKFIIAGLFAVIIIAVTLAQLQSGFLSKTVGSNTIENKLNMCGFTDEEWELLRSEGVTDEGLDEMIANASSPGVVCETLDGILYSSGDSDEDMPEVEEEEEYTEEEEVVVEPVVEDEPTLQEKNHNEALLSNEQFLTEELPSLLQPFDEAGIEYETEIAIQGAESTGSVYIRVVIDNTNYSSWDIKQLIPRSTNEKYINVIFTTIDGERLAFEIY